MTAYGVLWSVLSSHLKTDMDLLDWVQNKAVKKVRRDWSVWHKEKLRAGMFSFLPGEGSEGMSVNTWWERTTEMEPVFSVVLREQKARTKGKQHKWIYKKFKLNIRRKLFYCEGSQILEHIAQEGYDSSMLGDAQNQTRRSPEPPALIGPALSRMNEPADLQIFLPTTTVL